MKKKAAFFTLGCKVNFCESEALQVLFEEAGYSIVGFKEPADVYVVNTCTVTAQSDHKSRKAIRQARRRAEEALIVATGCYAQQQAEALEKMPEIDLLIGNKERQNLPGLIENLSRQKTLNLVTPHQEKEKFELLPPVRHPGRTRGFLKIQEGCDQFCTYCIIPYARGPVRSMPPGEVILRARALVEAGCPEIVLTGIHLGLYGTDQDFTLAELLKKLETLPGLLRLRLSSIEPSDVTSELVKVIVHSSIICPHLHIPLQAGDDEILKKMNRPYEAQEYLYLAKWLQQEIPYLSLSTDYMVGFPGETEQHFKRGLELVEEIGFSRLHVFKYSPRPGTAAATMPGQVSTEDKDRRSQEAILLGHKLAREYEKKFIRTVQPVLVEKVVPYEYAEGFTPHYVRVRIKSKIKGTHWRGKEVRACLTGSGKDALFMSADLSKI